MPGLTSLLAPETDRLPREVADLLGVPWIGGPWEARIAAVESGEATEVWLCGLLHAEWLAGGEWHARPFAAVGSRRDGHGGLPVYFGDVVVRADHPAGALADTAGGTLAFNEVASLSGFQMLRRALADRGEDLTFFCDTLPTGSHAGSIAAVIGGMADVAVIDSTIIDEVGLMAGLKVIASLGPYPAPPFVSVGGDPPLLPDHPDIVAVGPEPYTLARLAGPDG